MATQQAAPRIPLVYSTGQRDETANKFDARVINGCVESTEDGIVVVKRPAIQAYQTLAAGPLGTYYWNGHIYSVAGGNLYKDATILGAVSATGGAYSFASVMGATPRLVFHNNGNFYFTDGTTITANAAGAGACALQGLAYLDATLYGSPGGQDVRGSGINDPTTWDVLNLIRAQQEPDTNLAVYKQLQYVVVFKLWTTELFWDAGNPTGSPLQSAPGTLIPFGCRQPGSIQQLEDTLIWASATRNGSIGVMAMVNARHQTISTPAIERLLQDADWTTVYSWCGRIGGHRFYCLTLVNANFSLVFDFTTKMWFQWTYGTNQTYLPFMFCTSLPNRQILLQHENGNLYTLSDIVYADDLNPIYTHIYTPNWDGNTRNRKVLKRMEFIADQARMGTIQVSWSDDDYQTWSNPHTIDLGRRRPYLDDCGTFYKRAFHLYHDQPTALRLKALELTGLMVGSS